MTHARATTLEELEAEFAQISTRFEALRSGSGPDLWSQPPQAGSWSASDCVQHLNLTSDAYFPVWQQVISSVPPRKSELSRPYRTDFWGRLLSWMLEPPPRIRAKTPPPFQPVDAREIDSVLQAFRERQERIVAALHRCRGRDIDQVKIASPVDGRIRYSIWSSFVVNAAHQRRHLWQAEQAVEKARAPQPGSGPDSGN